ncbi:asparagine synthase [Brevibacillus antibioticus]|uniref:asparagine synthase (glutamine-hydrolyzing) n=1 Tax=Brevibacillus antibioticus TaxID=2570228 RepID=A0A4U2Y6K2_9BACL|nr:asparagine synthetase B family protein [Brevibacillus antibioticus]TKI54821.1 asparagine synthase [Brevibacillus antibioticus]
MHNLHDFYGEVGDTQSLINTDFTSKLLLWGKSCFLSSKKNEVLESDTRFTIAVRGAGLKASHVLKLINMEGINGLKKVDGNCSVVVIDRNKQTIVMYRGPVGRYPLYWRQRDNMISWSTDINHLEKETLDALYFYRYFIGMGLVDCWEETPYKGIHRVPRGQAIIFNKFARPEVLFNDQLNPKTGMENIGETEVFEQYLNLLQNSLIKHRGQSALFECSGGLDSSSLLIANKQLNHTGDSSITYRWSALKGLDESNQAQMISQQADIPWNIVEADELLPMSHIHTFAEEHFPDEPSLDLFFYPWRVPIFQMAKRLGHKNIISGHGADHLLQGNYCFIADLLKQMKIKTAWQHALSASDAAFASGLKAFWFLKSYGLFPLLHLSQKPPLISNWDPAIHNRFITPSFMVDFGEVKTIMRDMENDIKKIKLNTEYATQLSRTMSTITQISDSEALGRNFGIELNFPYIDRPLIEFILGLPYSYTIQGSEAKVITKRIFKKYFPKDFVRVQGDYYRLTFLALQKYWTDIMNLIVNSPLCEAGIISRERTIDFLEKWRAGKEVDSTSTIIALISACFWISKSKMSF